VNKARNVIDRAGMIAPLPNINPNVLTGMSVVTSLLFILCLKYPLMALAFLVATLLLDWLDGVTARKFSRATENGYLADVAGDRFSEGLIFMVFFFPWFYLFSLNCLLSLISVKRKRHLILPLRHVFLVFYVFLFFSGQI
jgi:phosphatidylglycerophosphate synthase